MSAPIQHHARLKGDVQGRPDQPVIADRARGFTHGLDFGVGGWIVAADRLVVPLPQTLIVPHEQRADRHLARLCGASGLVERQGHPRRVLSHTPPGRPR